VNAPRLLALSTAFGFVALIGAAIFIPDEIAYELTWLLIGFGAR
jgi:hypothetical protein